MKTTLLREITARLVAIENCRKSGNAEWETKHGQALDMLEAELPSGSGVDNGTKIDRDASNRSKLVLYASYHHMNDGGYYDGWTEHTITVKPDLLFGFTLTIGGRNRNDIKDYLHEIFDFALRTEIDTAHFFDAKPAQPVTA